MDIELVKEMDYMIVNKANGSCLLATFLQMDGPDACFMKGGLGYRVRDIQNDENVFFIPLIETETE